MTHSTGLIDLRHSHSAGSNTKVNLYIYDYDMSKDIKNQSFIQFRIVSFKYHVLSFFYKFFQTHLLRG